MWERLYAILDDSSGLSDPRMDRFLMKSPLQMMSIIGVYLFLVCKVGPQLMKNRKPFSLKSVLVSYNITQIVCNALIFLELIPFRRSLSLLCTPYDTSSNELNMRSLRCHHWFLLLKYFDLVETVFFVLRKKERQISFLHVYHHVGMIVAAFVSGKYFPGGQAVFVALYNTIIHCIMYIYYLIASWDPNYRNFWWKKYVTALQIVQHFLIFLSVFPVVINPNCTYPKAWMGVFSLNVLLIIHLFVRFYRKTYLQRAKVSDEKNAKMS